MTADSAPQARILVVDDSRLMRRAITKILRKCDIVEAVDGEDGWNKLSEDDTIEVVISDLSMPHLDGFGLLDIIRCSSIEHIQNIPVIIITGAEDDEGVKSKALEMGASDFITKPFDSVQLNARISAHSRHSKTRRELKYKSEALQQTRETAQELKQQSNIDGLTKLTNINYFNSQGIKDVAYIKRHRGELSLVRIDIDGFDQLFIKLGKDVCQRMLISVAAILNDNTRTEDTVSRIGVAKFGIILPSANVIGSRKLAGRIRQQIYKQEFDTRDGPVHITASVGLVSPEIKPGIEFIDILEIAEQRTALASLSGGNLLIDRDKDELPPETAEAIKSAINSPLPFGATIKKIEMIDEPGIEQAIKLIASGHAQKLDPHLPALLHKLLPLLELCQDKLNINMELLIAWIKNQDS